MCLGCRTFGHGFDHPFKNTGTDLNTYVRVGYSGEGYESEFTVPFYLERRSIIAPGIIKIIPMNNVKIPKPPTKDVIGEFGSAIAPKNKNGIEHTTPIAPNTIKRVPVVLPMTIYQN